MAALADHQRRLALPTAMQEALALLRRAHGDSHPATATSLLGLAMLERERGDYAAAVRLAEEALGIYTTLLGPEHPDVAFALVEIATSDILLGDPEAAIEPARRALEIRAREGLSPLLAAEARSYLGRAMWLAGRDRDAAVAELLAARAVYISSEASEEARAELDAWLRERGLLAPP